MNATGILHTGLELINLPCSLTGIGCKTTEGQVPVDGMRRTMERVHLEGVHLGSANLSTKKGCCQKLRETLRVMERETRIISEGTGIHY